MNRLLRHLGLVVLLATIAAGLSGCASTDPDNYSERPWNSQKTWESGLPAGMMEGR